MEKQPVLKIGVFGDPQGLASRHDWGMRNFALALDIFREKNTDLLLSMGDTAEFGNPDTYALYWQMIEERFGKNGVLHFACEGNHDLEYRDPDFAFVFANACKGLRRPAELIYHEKISGYDFVAFAEDQKGKCKHSDESCEKLERFLETLSKDKPVFLLSHHPPADTMAGSHGKEGVKKLREVLNKFPNVIALSGHTHWPLADETAIWQGEFSAVTTSTLAYACMGDKPCANNMGGLIPYAREGVNILYMELFEDRLEIERIHVLDNAPIGEKWSIALPYKPENAVYTASRSRSFPVPEFPEDAEFLIRYDFGYWYFAVTRPEITAQYFEVEIQPLSFEGEMIFQRYIGDFHRMKENRSSMLFFKLPGAGIRSDEDYKIKVYPVNCFGVRGKPLEMIEHSWKNYKFKEEGILCPQE